MFNDLYTHCDFNYLAQEVINRDLPMTKIYEDGTTGHLIYQGQFGNCDEHKFAYASFKAMKPSDHKTAVEYCHNRLNDCVVAIMKKDKDYKVRKEKRRQQILEGLKKSRARLGIT